MEMPTVNDRYSAADIESYYGSGLWAAELFGDLLSRRAAERGTRRSSPTAGRR